MNTPLLSTKGIAALLNVSEKTIYYYVHRREIPFLKIGKHLRFNVEQVLSHFQKETEMANPCNHLSILLEEPKSQRSLKIEKRSLAFSKGESNGDS